MLAPDPPERFSREMGFTEADWLRSLPGAVGRHALTVDPGGRAQVRLTEGGTLSLRWLVLAPRQIALARVPRMQVDFEFVDTAAPGRAGFMRRFDLYLQRGGG